MKNNVPVLLNIEGRQYAMRKMPPVKAATFGLKVSSVLSKLLSAPNAKELLLKLQKAADGGEDALGAVPAIMGLLSCVDPNEIDAIFKEALSYEVYCGDKRLGDETVFDEHFSEFPGDLYVVCAWAAYNHVKDFFSGLGAGLKALGDGSKTASAEGRSSFPKAQGLNGL